MSDKNSLEPFLKGSSTDSDNMDDKVNQFIVDTGEKSPPTLKQTDVYITNDSQDFQNAPRKESAVRKESMRQQQRKSIKEQQKGSVRHQKEQPVKKVKSGGLAELKKDVQMVIIFIYFVLSNFPKKIFTVLLL